jgi:hypothetical protein
MSTGADDESTPLALLCGIGGTLSSLVFACVLTIPSPCFFPTSFPLHHAF